MCTSPLEAARLESGQIKFGAFSGEGIPLNLPCGQCMECRLERSRQWAVRCVHEQKMHDQNCFITLTYNDDNLPDNAQLHYPHFQSFMREMRRKLGKKIRFYMCGEYGEKFKRPHYHACIFGHDFTDRVIARKSGAGFYSYTSESLSALWKYGDSYVGDLTFESAAYTARYVTTKLLGEAAKNAPVYVNSDTGELFKRIPEFTKMSLKPGIGRFFYEKFKSDIFPHDRVVIRGVQCRPPRYYSKLYSKSNALEWEDISYKRSLKYKVTDNAPDRLNSRNICAVSRNKRLSRSTF